MSLKRIVAESGELRRAPESPGEPRKEPRESPGECPGELWRELRREFCFGAVNINSRGALLQT
eukprot:2312009-Alexandrium_andersonii.AAC.1